MTTAIIILATILILLSGVAVLLVVRYMRRNTLLDMREAEIKQKEFTLRRRQNDLELREKQFNIEARKVVKTIHVYASRTIEDPEDSAPEVPDKVTYKKLASQFGYAAYKQFKHCVARQHEDGKTSYKLDLNVYPYNL